MSNQGKYYILRDDMRISGRWQLDAPVDDLGNALEPWRFKQGRILNLNSLPLFRLDVRGRPLELTLTGFTIPLVHRRVVSVFERLGLQQEVQFLPARVEGQEELYFILNVLRIIRCIDDARCEEVRLWEPRHGDPGRVGEYRNVVGLKVDALRVGDANIFRPWGWTVVMVVSERIKLAMEAEGITGTNFTEA